MYKYKLASEHLFPVIFGVYLKMWLEQGGSGEDVREAPRTDCLDEGSWAIVKLWLPP